MGEIEKIIHSNATADQIQAIDHMAVRRVKSLFKLADQIEPRYKKAKVHADRLERSILAKAFRGELVSERNN